MKLLGSKLSVPEVASHSINRPRLTWKILSSSKANLILLIAPAGYGKTTLIAQLVSPLPRNGRAWYHLDRQDTEPSRFLSYLIEAVSQSIPALRESGFQERLIPGRAPDIDIVDDLCFFLQEYRGPDLRLVLDNWEAVNDHEQQTDIILRLASAGRRNLRLIVASRVKPAFSTRKLQESGQAVIIDKDELAFNFSEFIDALKSRTPLRLEEAQIEHLWQKTAGWCVSIGLLLESFRGRSLLTDGEISAAGKSLRSINEYVEEELLKGMSSDLGSFLARCSVLDVISPESAATVIPDDGDAIAMNLRLLRESTLPHVVLDQPETFRLHPLVRQAFNQILRKASDRAGLFATYQAAARYFRQQGAALEAVQLLMDLPDHDAALQAIEEDWHAVVAANGLSRVRAWLERFPANLQSTPLYVKIRTQLLSIAGENRELVEYLSDKLNADRYEGNLAALGNLWIHYHWELLHISPATDYTSTKRKWQVLKRRCGNLGISIEAGVHVVLSLAAHQELRDDRAIEHSRTCLSMLNETQFDYRMTVKSNIALFTHFSGKSEEALGQFHEIVNECEGKGAFTIVPMVLVNISEVHLSCGRYRLALESAERALQVLGSHGKTNRGVEMYADRCRGIARWYLGEMAEGIKHLNNSYDKSLEYDERERSAISLWLDYFHLRLGARREPRVTATSVLGSRTEQRLLWLGREAMERTQRRQWSALGKAAADLYRLAGTTKSRGWKVTAGFLTAIWADGCGKQASAKRFLRTGLSELGRLGWSSYPMADDSVSSFVIVKSFRYGIGRDSARLLLKGDHRFDLATAFTEELGSKTLTSAELRNLLVSAADLQVRGLAATAKRFLEHGSKIVATSAQRYLEIIPSIPLPPLYIRMLGGFSVIAGGRNVSFSRKKSRQLLQLLLIEQGRSLHEEVIVETLWPDSDPAKSVPILRTCVKDLRRALDSHHDSKGPSYIGYANEHYRLDLPDGSTVDTIEFEDLLIKAGFRQPTTPIRSQDQENILGSAAAMYRGELLPEERFEAYAVEYRERLLQKFLDLSVARAQFLMAKGKTAEAIAALERGLQLDPLWGEGVREMMAARVKNGELYRAFHTYRAYEKRLQQELAISPDQSLTEYFDELVASLSLAE